MKKILCFGDSNTYGYNPETMGRYDEKTRWSAILKNLSKDDFEITFEGLNNRTGFKDNPLGEEYTGYKIFKKYLNDSFDIIVISLGINDAQVKYNLTSNEIKEGIENLIDIAHKACPKAKIILISPAKLSKDIFNSVYFSTLFDEKSIEKSCLYSKIYSDVAKEKGCEFIDWDKIVKVSKFDGLHFSKSSHQIIAKNLYDKLKSI